MASWKSYFAEVKMSGGHEQTIVGVANGDFDAGVTWADGLGNWEDGYNSGAFRKAADAGLVDMNEPRRNLALDADPRRPDGRPRGPAAGRQGQGHPADRRPVGNRHGMRL